MRGIKLAAGVLAAPVVAAGALVAFAAVEVASGNVNPDEPPPPVEKRQAINPEAVYGPLPSDYINSIKPRRPPEFKTVIAPAALCPAAPISAAD